MSDTAATRLSRLLALVPWLLANDGVTLAHAAEHFGVSAEQLEKDLFLLIVSGFPGMGPINLSTFNSGTTGSSTYSIHRH